MSDAVSDSDSPYVFLSYASADRNRALAVASALESSGIPVWIDRSGISGGTSWAEEIVSAVRGCAVLAVLCSAASMDSRNVRQELQLAWDEDRPILPLMSESVQFPDGMAFFLLGRQWIDLIGRNVSQWLPDLTAAVKRLGVVASPSQTQPTSLAARIILPSFYTQLVGRDRELDELASELIQGSARLSTLTGPGGVGKTRLAVEAARAAAGSFPGGVDFIDLAPVASPDLVASSIALAMGIREAGKRPIQDILQSAFAARPRSLLLLDNFEQVIDAAPLIADLLAGAPNLHVLVTSRESLRIRDEREIAIKPLNLPAEGHRAIASDVAGNAAVVLFVEAAAAVKPGFGLTEENAGAVAGICRRLDGLPLAIELAATRVRLFPPALLLERLEHRLPVLTGGARDLPARQQTLRNAIAWSYDLLAAGEQALFRRLGLFAGGATVDAIETVVPATGAIDLDFLTGLSSLVNKNLVREIDDPDGAPRFSMLDTIREFALDQLDATGEYSLLQEIHANWCLTLIRNGSAAFKARHDDSWFQRVDAELDNLRSALDWALDHQESELALQLCERLWPFWYRRGLFAEGRRWMEAALAIASTEPSVAMAWTLTGAGFLAHYQGDYARAAVAAEQGLTMFRELDDPLGLGYTLQTLGTTAEDQGDYGTAEPLFAEAQAQFERAESISDWGLAIYHAGVVAYGQGDLDQALNRLEDALELGRTSGIAVISIAAPLEYMGLIFTERGELGRAADACEEALALTRATADQEGYVRRLATIAVLAAACQRFEPAVRLLAAADALRVRIGLLPHALPEGLAYAGALESARSQLNESAFAEAWQEGRSRAPDDCLADVRAILEAARAATG